MSTEAVIDSAKKSGSLTKNVIMEAIPRIAAFDWDPVRNQYKVNASDTQC